MDGQRHKHKQRAGESERKRKQDSNVRFDGSMHLAFVSATYPSADQHLISSSVDSTAAVLNMLSFPEKKRNNFSNLLAKIILK